MKNFFFILFFLSSFSAFSQIDKVPLKKAFLTLDAEPLKTLDAYELPTWYKGGMKLNARIGLRWGYNVPVYRHMIIGATVTSGFIKNTMASVFYAINSPSLKYGTYTFLNTRIQALSFNLGYGNYFGPKMQNTFELNADIGISQMRHKSEFSNDSITENRIVKYESLSIGFRPVVNLSVNKYFAVAISAAIGLDGKRSDDTEILDNKGEAIHYAMPTGGLQSPVYLSFGIGISYCIWHRLSASDRK